MRRGLRRRRQPAVLHLAYSIEEYEQTKAECAKRMKAFDSGILRRVEPTILNIDEMVAQYGEAAVVAGLAKNGLISSRE